MTFLRKIAAILRRLAQADMVFWLLPPLMALLVAGTLAQPLIGLYAAHKVFFASFIIWAGPVPLPGGYTLLGLLTFHLTLKFIFQSRWRREKTGIHLIHLGALILLGGGLVTSISAREGYMALKEGETSPYVYDYTERSMMVAEDGRRVDVLDFKELAPGRTILPARLPFSMRVQKMCKNCKIIERTDTPEVSKPLRGLAEFMALVPSPPGLEPEADIGGLTLDITGADEKNNGLYIIFEAMPEPLEIHHKDRVYKIALGKSQRRLPFSVELSDFKIETYPDRWLAKNYISEINIIHNDARWPVRIEMNKPLRYQGYTFYQSAYENMPEGHVSILAVVRNRGWLLPYIGAAILGIGFMLHLFLMYKKRKTP